jgi:transcriptional regulator with PAS, ATPase and Fis domain
LPAEAVVDRESLLNFKVVSTLAVPLFAGGVVTHYIGIDTLRFERGWPIDIVRNVKLLGEIFVAAMRRCSQELELEQYRSRLDLASVSAEIGFWELDRATGEFWVTEQARNFFGFSADEQITMDVFLNKVCDEDKAVIVDSVAELQVHDELIVEYRALRENCQRWFCSKGRLLPPNGSDRDVLMGMTQDVTDRKVMEQNLKEKVSEITSLRHQLEAENLYLKNEVSAARGNTKFIGGSLALRRVQEQAEQVAMTDSTVLISGETGTGKELLAQMIHKMSQRAKKSMVKVNCAALPDALVESELFGREKGAYTGALSSQVGRFELADESTLFLDEISEMPLETQAKLLRVLQEGEFQRLGNPRSLKANVRIVAASNRNLLEEVDKGRFRKDLYYRLSIFPVTIPPLRERPEDIPPLIWDFVSEFGNRMGKKIRKILPADMLMLQSYPWPGNVRELRNVLEHAMIVSKDDVLKVKPLTSVAYQEKGASKLVDVERRHISRMIEAAGGRIKGVGGAADLLGMNPSTLYSRMHKLGLKNSHGKG